MKKHRIKILFTAFVLLFLIGISSMAQPQNPPPPDEVPITGLEYLLISGGLLGGYKLLKKKLQKDQNI
jgi:hypothetical protein